MTLNDFLIIAIPILLVLCAGYEIWIAWKKRQG